MAGVQLYEFFRVWPAVKFCELQTWVATAELDALKICNSILALLSPIGPVSVTVSAMVAVPPAVNVDGFKVEEVNTTPELTVMLPADAFQLHCCQVALNSPTSIVYVPAIAGVSLNEYF